MVVQHCANTYRTQLNPRTPIESYCRNLCGQTDQRKAVLAVHHHSRTELKVYRTPDLSLRHRRIPSSHLPGTQEVFMPSSPTEIRLKMCIGQKVTDEVFIKFQKSLFIVVISSFQPAMAQSFCALQILPSFHAHRLDVADLRVPILDCTKGAHIQLLLWIPTAAASHSEQAAASHASQCYAAS